VAAAVVQPPSPPPAAPEALTLARPRSADKHSLKLVGRDAARAAERELMLHMLHRTRWNRKEAASMLGISYKALLYKIKEHKLDDPISDQDSAERE